MRHLAGDAVDVMSAGSHPSDKVNPLAIEVMHERGIDISSHRTKSLLSVKDMSFDWVITLCDYAKDACPVFYGKDGKAKMLHWSIKDPIYASGSEDDRLKVYRTVRDEIEERIKKWLQEQGLRK
jgi:arsenate reductase (thioredoxin)